MFDKTRKALLVSCALKMNGELRYAKIKLQYEFTADLAQSTGGPAIRVFEALTTEYDRGSVGPVPIRIAAKPVNFALKEGRIKHPIGDTIALDLRALPVSKNNLLPILDARVAFAALPDQVAFIYENLGRMVHVSMDAQQLELPVIAGTADDDLEPDDYVPTHFDDIEESVA